MLTSIAMIRRQGVRASLALFASAFMVGLVSTSAGAAEPALPSGKAAKSTARATLDQVENKELVMFVGEIKSVPASKVSRVALGNGNILSTRFLDEHQMLLIAEAIGDTSLVMWTPRGDMQHYTVRVGPKDSAFAYRAAKSVLSDISGIEIKPLGSSIAITGSASPAQVARISSLAARYPQIVPLLKEMDVEMKKMIYMKVQILEVKKSLSEQLGVSWPGAISGLTVGLSGNFGSNDPVPAAAVPGLALPVPISGLNAYLGITSLIQSTINMAKANGDLTIIAEPELSARSGNSASFLAGGQIPIQTAGALGAVNISYKDYGIKLNIKPTADDAGNVIAAVKAELSQLDQSTALGGQPGFLTRISETEINVKSGQTMVISGLINRDMQNDISAIPGLGNLPVIGRLFRSDSFRGGQTDMLIAVTPFVVDPTSASNRERVERSIQMKDDFERNLSKRNLAD
jgi:pilus assembly protein CpaC